MTILHVDSSILAENSVSRRLTHAIVERLVMGNPAETIIYRDLDSVPRATIGAENAQVDDFLTADTVVIGAPMYNFTVPSQLKAWIDSILVAGRTFRYTPEA